MSLRLDLYLRELGDLPNDVRWAWSERRTAGAWSEIRRRTLDQLYERGRVTVLEQDLTRVSNPPRPSGVQLGTFAGPDWAALAHLAPRRMLRSFARRAAAGESTCWVAWRNGRVVGYEWWSTRLDPNLDLLTVPLPTGTAYGHDLYVAAEERGHGVGSALAHRRLIDAHEHGFRRLWRLIDGGNRASWRTAEKSAAGRVAGEVAFVKTPGRLRVRYQPIEAH